jgi:hypothetical protein
MLSKREEEVPLVHLDPLDPLDPLANTKPSEE